MAVLVRPRKTTGDKFERALRQIESWYTLRSAKRVRQFIRAHRPLAALLVEAQTPLQDAFSPAPQVFLDVVSDREEDGHEELFAYIRTSLPPAEALRRLHELDEKWFLNQVDRASHKFNFNLEFG